MGRKLLKIPEEIDAKDEKGMTLLLKGVVNSDLKKIRILIELGADISLKNNDGKGSIHLAVEASNLEALKILLETNEKLRKKIVNERDGQGMTPLMIAILSE